jgi:negative regulator of sigma E activity
MSEHIHEQISAFLDDELSAEESAFLVRRFTGDTLAHQQTVRYAAIGSVLREEGLLANSMILRDRIHAVLEGAHTTQGPVRVQSQGQMRWARMLAAVSVAASVAVVALLGLRMLADADSSAVPSIANAPGAWIEPGSYVVPGDSMPVVQVVTPLPMRFTNYMMQHGQVASMLNRTSVQSNVITEGESELTESMADELQVQ